MRKFKFTIALEMRRNIQISRIREMRTYRNAQVAGELRITEAPGANVSGELRSAAGIAAVEGGYSRRIVRITGDIVEEAVGHNGVFVRKV